MRSPVRHGALALVALGLVILAAGCGKGTSSTGPGTPLNQDAADDIALNSVAALSTVGGDVQAGVSVSAGAAPQQGAAHLTATFWDTTFTRNGVTYNASRTFYDALGNPLPGFGPTAAKLVWTSQASGTWEGERDTATVGHNASLQITGIPQLLAVADTFVVNGASDDTLLNRFRSYDGTRTRYFHWVSSLAISNVEIARGGSYPVSGTVTFTVSADRLRSNSVTDVESHWNATVVITFNGAGDPDVVVNGTWRYHWNVVTGQITRG